MIKDFNYQVVFVAENCSFVNMTLTGQLCVFFHFLYHATKRLINFFLLLQTWSLIVIYIGNIVFANRHFLSPALAKQI